MKAQPNLEMEHGREVAINKILIMVNLNFPSMKYCVFLLFCLSSCILTEKKIGHENDNIKGISIRELISEDIINLPISEVKNTYKQLTFKINEEFSGYEVSNSKKTMFLFLSVLNDTVKGISLTQKNAIFYNGLRIGDSIKSLNKYYQNLIIEFDNLNNLERFVISDNRCKLVVYVTSNDENILGIYNSDLFSTSKKFSSNGFIQSISQYDSSYFIERP